MPDKRRRRPRLQIFLTALLAVFFLGCAGGRREVPFLGLEGEEILTEDDPRHIRNVRRRLTRSNRSGRTLVVNWNEAPNPNPLGLSDAQRAGRLLRAGSSMLARID